MSRTCVRVLCGAGFAALLSAVAVVSAQSTLGTAQSFAVLGGSTVTNTGPSVITGDLGVSPGSAVTGFPPGIVTGTIHAANATAGQAQNDTTTFYNSLASQACSADLTGQDLGGMTLIPGVYCFSSSAQLTGTLTLNAQGNANAIFVFKTGSTLTTASGSSVVMINGGNPCGVAWQIGSSATLGTTTSFIGNLVALTSITLNTGADIIGRALARNGAVTLDTNDITFVPCSAGGGPPPVPTLTTWAMIALIGLLGLAGIWTLSRRQAQTGRPSL
jgi:MYXO-CTERM domain-containing protein